jgi:diguanylate cyclase (GGDEF)-like protein
MDKLQNRKQMKIYEIVSIVKLFSLLFSGIILLRGLNDVQRVLNNTLKGIFSTGWIMAVGFILVLVYIIWSWSTTKRIDFKYFHNINLIEDFIYILIFFIIILLSGANTSEYKFIFLFIIISATIQSGMKQGITVACISSSIILIIDIMYMPYAEVNQYFENDLILSGLFILTAWPLGYYVKLEKDHISRLESLANEDGLTGVYNHRYFHQSLKEKIIYSEKNNKQLSLVFIDIDYFKYYNDLYGHQKGDEILRKIGQLLKDTCRTGDIAARYGGEEFALLLPETSTEEAYAIAERLRSLVEMTYFEGQENQPNGTITISVGIATYPDKAKNDVELIKCADDALYRAKFFNKNRVEAYSSILDELKKDIEEEHIDLITSIKTLISVINAKDRYTYGHVERVVIYSRVFAEKLGLSEEQKKYLIYGAYMHDIGKINIAENVLNKKMPLDKQEWEILKQHSENGVEIIKSVESLKEVAPLILYHHERYDGTGYPHNLKGKEIPFLARILTVVDSFDAMTSHRPYNKRRTYEEAIEELKKCSGTQFDPEIAEAFIQVIQEGKFNINSRVSTNEVNGEER